MVAAPGYVYPSPENFLSRVGFSSKFALIPLQVLNLGNVKEVHFCSARFEGTIWDLKLSLLRMRVDFTVLGIDLS